MRKALILTAALASSVALAGCQTVQEDRAATGAALGGAGGALIGAAAGGTAGAALLGGALGAATGAIVGANTAPAAAPPPRRARPACAEDTYDYYGNPVCTAYYGY